MAKVVFSKAAAAEISEETRYLRDRSPAAAKAFRKAISEAKRILGQYPKVGAANDFVGVPGERKFVTGGYVVAYDLDDDGRVVILDVRHGRELREIVGFPVDADPEDDPNPVSSPSDPFKH
jgi:plasmid stabilization system protein ParE